MLILQTIIFFFALLFTIQGVFQYTSNCINVVIKLNSKYKNIEWKLFIASILWSLLFYLKS